MPKSPAVLHFGEWSPSSDGAKPCFSTVVYELWKVLHLTLHELAKLTGLLASAVSDLEHLRRPAPLREHVDVQGRLAASPARIRSQQSTPLELSIDQAR